MSFNVGDIVQCVDATNCHEITYGHHYTVKKVGLFGHDILTKIIQEGIVLIEASPVEIGVAWRANRFRKVGLAQDERILVEQMRLNRPVEIAK